MKISVAHDEMIELQVGEHSVTISVSQRGLESSLLGKPKSERHGRRKVSAAARARMAEGQRKRWAGIHSQGKNAPPPMDTQPATAKKSRKRQMSAEARARIAEATRLRWAKARKQGKKAL